MTHLLAITVSRALGALARPAGGRRSAGDDRQNARIEHDKALKRVITALFSDDAQLFKQFQDNESFRRWLTDTVFGMTYDEQEREV